MGSQKVKKWLTTRSIRLLQLALIFVVVWFVFWAHFNEMTTYNKTFIESVQSSPFNVMLYSVSILALIYLEMHLRRMHKTNGPQPAAKTTEDLQRENEQLRKELLKSKQLPSNKIGLGFLVSGAFVLSASIIASSTVLAFIGLGLAFWGGLFLFTRPARFVRGALLDSTALSSYTTIDRITQDLNYKGKPIYMPPYPKEAYLPEYLKGLKETIVYIPADSMVAVPTIDELAKKQFLLKNPKGICIAPPGYGLIRLFEEELKAEFTQIDMDRLCSSLPIIAVNNLGLAKGIEMTPEKNIVHVKMTDSVYKDLYSDEQGLKSVHSIGCPLTSAIACALARTTAKLVSIAKDAVSPDLKTIDVWYQIMET